MNTVQGYAAAVKKAIEAHESDLAKRKQRFDYLLGKWEQYIGINDEQAEAYEVRMRHHEKKIEDELYRLVTLRNVFYTLVQKKP